MKISKQPIVTIFLFLLTIVGILAAIIFYLNSGTFVYSLDDAYIHLALSENLKEGHYGVNSQEYSSPSSSIIWPYLLSFFGLFNIGVFGALIINILSMLGVSAVIFKAIEASYPQVNHKINIAVVILFILFIGSIPIAFMGMEHSLQCFVASMLAYYLVQFHRDGVFSWFFVVLIVLAPLVRYENIALSFSIILYLFFSHKRISSVVSAVACTVSLSFFTWFLLDKGLDFLPSSVLVKNSLLGEYFDIESSSLARVLTFLFNILYPKGFVVFFMLLYSFNKIESDDKKLFYCLALSTLLYYLGGMTFIYRYFGFFLCFVIVVFIHLIRNIDLYSFFWGKRTPKIIFTVVFVGSLIYSIFKIIIIPIASNNIYEQQYQMARFSKEYYKQPIAVNDLGLMAYKNPSYVLDLVGLASNDVRHLSRKYDRKTKLFLNKVFESSPYEVKIAMIYTEWFPNRPDSWKLIAELSLGKIRVSPLSNIVRFYSIEHTPLEKEKLLQQLDDFKKTLPEGVSLEIFENS